MYFTRQALQDNYLLLRFKQILGFMRLAIYNTHLSYIHEGFPPNMDISFWHKLGLSFLVGSAWVTLSTLAAERFGSKVGGLIGGLPSTVVVSLFFIGFTQSPSVASEATTLIPITQGLNGVFIILYLLFVKLGFLSGLSSAIFVWFIWVGILLAASIHSIWVSLVGWVLLSLCGYLVVEKMMNIPSQGGVILTYTAFQIAGRALFGGAVIAFAVLIGKLGGPIIGGIFSTFPAMFLSTLIITYRTGGVEFSRSVAKALMVSGSINVPLYALVVRVSYPWFGLVYGTGIAILFSCLSGYLTYLFMRGRLH